MRFDASELVARVDELLVDVRDPRERVHELAAIVGDGATPAPSKQKKHKKHKHGKKAKTRNE